MPVPGGRLNRAGTTHPVKTDVRSRTRDYALRIIRLYSALPKTNLGRIIGGQMVRSGTSVAAHVAESNRARSRADFTAKIDGAMMELEETMLWMDLVERSGMMKSSRLQSLVAESDELMAIFVSMVKKTRKT
jgi:four helix bundle protein